MRISVLGGCGAWPAAGEACSGYLVDTGPSPDVAELAAARPAFGGEITVAAGGVAVDLS